MAPVGQCGQRKTTAQDRWSVVRSMLKVKFLHRPHKLPAIHDRHSPKSREKVVQSETTLGHLAPGIAHMLTFRSDFFDVCIRLAVTA